MSETGFSRMLRYGLFLFGVIGLVLAFGFFTRQTWATMWIPWELNRLAGIFLASIWAAIACPVLWIALTREYAALTGGALNLFVIVFGFAIFSFQAYLSNPRPPVLLFGIVSAVWLPVTFGVLRYARKQPAHDNLLMPKLVRYSFVLFCVILLLSGTALILKLPNIFPWQLTSQQSVLYGCIFLGNATYFMYGVARPYWWNAKGQLIAFLAYDIVLLVPLALLPFSGEAFLQLNLTLYIAVLVYSAALASYYLFLNRVTKLAITPLRT